MRVSDTQAVTRLHHQAMGDSLWAKLGCEFLDSLYGQLIHNSKFLGFVYTEDDVVRGFIVGSEHVSRMYLRVGIFRGYRLLIPVVRGIVGNPGLVSKLITTGTYFRASAVDQEVSSIKAESLFCSFDRDLRGRRIAGHINKVLFDELAYRGHRFVKITTEVDNLGANRQLKSWGFEDRGRFTFYKKAMVVYVLDLLASARVQPKSHF